MDWQIFNSAQKDMRFNLIFIKRKIQTFMPISSYRLCLLKTNPRKFILVPFRPTFGMGTILKKSSFCHKTSRHPAAFSFWNKGILRVETIFPPFLWLPVKSVMLL